MAKEETLGDRIEKITPLLINSRFGQLTKLEQGKTAEKIHKVCLTPKDSANRGQLRLTLSSRTWPLFPFDLRFQFVLFYGQGILASVRRLFTRIKSMATKDQSHEKAKTIVYRDSHWFMEPEIGVVQAVQDLSNDKLMIFVHGYLGNYQNTWGDLNRLILKDPAFNNVDFCFVGYKASVSSVSVLGVYLGQLIQKASKQLGAFPKAYKHFVLIGHSLGGIAVRSAQLYLLDSDPALFSSIKFCVLGAPALFGAALSGLQSKWELIKAFGMLVTPVLADLTGKTNEIETVRQKYEQVVHARKQNGAPQSDIRWALYDRIVGPFPNGYKPPVPDTLVVEPYSHCDIVKPPQYAHPFYAALRQAAGHS
jgi:pimeloyl-ACP methyl ester carboxylesterase